MANDTVVYIDGFNFYYGVYVNNQATEKLKWLDFVKLSENLLHGYNVRKVKYFTAKVMALGDANRPLRQSSHWRALEAINGTKFERVMGNFRVDPRKMPIARVQDRGKKNVATDERIWVMKTEEKGSDVNLAVHLVFDACENNYDTAVVISNDSDLVDALDIVMNKKNKEVVLVSPFSIRGRNPVASLKKKCTRIKTLRLGMLSSSQLPDPIPGTNIHKPIAWK